MKEKNRFSKTLSFTLIVSVFLFAVLLFSGCEQPPGTVPDNDAALKILREIESARDLAKIGVEASHPLSGTYTLMNDITLSDWTPIGKKTAPFTGEFDGNGKTITLNGFNARAAAGTANENYLGIFGYVKGDSSSARAVIKNLKINSTVTVSSTDAVKQAVGLAAGYAEFAEITGVTLSGIFTFNSSKAIILGGVAGYINKTGTIIKDCSSSLTMNIAPGNGSGVQAYSFVGGVAGMFDNGAGIENCHNKGDITAAGAVTGSQIFAGGIAGGSLYAMNTIYRGYIQDCSYTGGTVLGRAKGFWTVAGGIAGSVSGGNNEKESSTRIERCFVKDATVSVAGTSSGNPYIGGIAGYVYFGARVIESCFTGTGKVIADKPGDYTGGIAGYVSQQTGGDNYARVSDCWSGGTIQGFNNAGGIVGQNQQSGQIERCYSIAAVLTTNGSGSGVGGIAGLNGNYANPVIKNCVALNTSLSSPGGNNIHRVAGNKDAFSTIANSYAWTGMTVNAGAGSSAADTGADGWDCGQKPDAGFYADTLGWDFAGVWKTGGDGYPELQWQK